MELNCKLLTTASELNLLTESWNDLLRTSDANSIFLTSEWIQTWLAVSDPEVNIFTILVYHDEKLVGIAPFYLAKIKFLGFIVSTCLRVMGDENSSAEYQDIVVHPEYSDVAIRKIADLLKKPDSPFNFVWIPYCSVSTGASDRFSQLIEDMGYEPKARGFNYYRLRLPQSKDTYSRGLTSKQRNNIRRYNKKLSNISNITFVDLADSVSSDSSVRILTDLHNLHWNSVGVQGVFDRKPIFSNFILEYSKQALQKNQLRALCLCLNKQPIAIRFGYYYNNTFYEIQAGYNPSYNGSGICAIDRAICFMIDQQASTYDFLAFEGGYKSRFNATPEKGESIFATRKAIFPRLVHSINLWPKGKYVSV